MMMMLTLLGRSQLVALKNRPSAAPIATSRRTEFSSGKPTVVITKKYIIIDATSVVIHRIDCAN